MPPHAPRSAVLGLLLVASGCGGRTYLQSARVLAPGQTRITLSAALTPFVTAAPSGGASVNPGLGLRVGVAERVELDAAAWMLGGALGFKAQLLGQPDRPGLALALGGAAQARKTYVRVARPGSGGSVDYVERDDVLAIGAEANLIVSVSGTSGWTPYVVFVGALERADAPDLSKRAFNGGGALGLTTSSWAVELGVTQDELAEQRRPHLALGHSF